MTVQVAVCEIKPNKYSFTQLPPLFLRQISLLAEDQKPRLTELLHKMEERLRQCPEPVDDRFIDELMRYRITTIKIENGNFKLLNR